MAKEKNKKSRIHESIMSRYRLIFVLIAAFALIIVGRLFRTTVVDAKEWNLKADSLLTIQNDLLPERGNILAADGSWLAVNVHFYEVRLDFRSTIFDEDEFRAALPALCDSLSVLKEGKTSKQWMDDFNRELAKPSEKRTRAFLIAQEMTDSEWNRLIKLPYFAKELKGHRKVSLSKTLREKRMKPYGKMAYRSIGNIVEHEDGSWHGSSGLEMALDSLLFGEYGKSKKEQFANGIRDWEEVAPVRGFDIKTTIDVRLQDIVENELYAICNETKPDWATAVLMEVSTGDIKAISNLSWNESSQDYVESVNNALLSWELGSVMKPISLMIALEDGYAEPSTVVELPIKNRYGKLQAVWDYAGARPITDDHYIGTYPTVVDVLAGSSNVGTAKIITKAFDKHPWEFRKRLEDIGFFDKLNIGLAGESKPVIQELGSPDKKFRNEWRINLSRCCYGYAVQIPPIHMLGLINAIANGGRFVRPRLVSEWYRNDSLYRSIPVDYVRERICSEETAKEIRAMMKDVVWSKKKKVPTAPLLQNNFVTLAGKTGSSRIFVPGKGYSTRLRLTFCGFFPYEKPQYSCIVVCNGTRTVRGPQYCSGKVVMNVALKMYARGMLGNKSDYRTEKDNSGEKAILTRMPSEQTDAIVKSLGLSGYERYKQRDTAEGTVPSVAGMGLREAVATLERAGLRVVEVKGAGHVVGQVPKAGSVIRKNEKATLQLSSDI